MESQRDVVDIIGIKNEDFGSQLRHAREKCGLSVVELAMQLKLDPRVVKAIENQDHTRLPQAAYVRGYIRNFAKVVKLDPEPLIASYREDFEKNQIEEQKISIVKTRQVGKFKSVSTTKFLFLSIILISAVAGTGVFLIDALKNQLNVADVNVKEKAASDVAEYENNDANDITQNIQGGKILAESSNEPGASGVRLVSPEDSLAEKQEQALNNGFKRVVVVNPDIDISEDNKPASNTQIPEQITSENLQQRGVEPIVAELPDEKVPENLSIEDIGAIQPDEGIASLTDNAIKPELQELNQTEQLEEPLKEQQVQPLVSEVESRESLELRFAGESWVEIKDAMGKRLAYGLKQKGEYIQLKGVTPYQLSLGNANVITITHNGELFEHKPFINARNVAKFNIE